jgi:N-acetylmuramoyl-L-alanine amidase
MTRSSKIKKEVLRAVYEDNAGIPRTCLGKRQSKAADEPRSPGNRPGYRSKVTLIVLLGLVTLIGINFRLVTVDVTGPVAMQMVDKQTLPYLTDPILMTTGRQGLMEKDVVLDIARRLRDKLVMSGNYRVLLTRDKDVKIFLKERVAFAKINKADLFISIHINSLPAEAASVNYVETYYFGQHTDQRSLELAEKENHDSDYAMGDFREVIARIGDTLKTEESKELASAIHGRLYSSMRRRNRNLLDAGSKTGPFVVLLGVEVPSVLVEVSCISNKAEETRLSKPEYRDDVAGFLKTGIVEYLEQRGYRRSVEGGKIQHVAKQEG